jgi:hypothetical protein
MAKHTTKQHDSKINDIRHERCATIHVHRRLAQQSPEYRRLRRQLELETRQFIARYQLQGLRTGVVRISGRGSCDLEYRSSEYY